MAHIFLCRIYLDALLILKMQARAEIAFYKPTKGISVVPYHILSERNFF